MHRSKVEKAVIVVLLQYVLLLGVLIDVTRSHHAKAHILAIHELFLIVLSNRADSRPHVFVEDFGEPSALIHDLLSLSRRTSVFVVTVFVVLLDESVLRELELGAHGSLAELFL